MRAPARFLRKDGKVQRGQFIGPLSKGSESELTVDKTGQVICGPMISVPSDVLARDTSTGKRLSAIRFKVLEPQTGEEIEVTVFKKDLEEAKRPKVSGPCWVIEKEGTRAEKGHRGELEGVIQRGEDIELNYGPGKTMKGKLISEPKTMPNRFDKITGEYVDCYQFQVMDPKNRKKVTVVVAKDQLEEERPDIYVGPALVQDPEFGTRSRLSTFIGPLVKGENTGINQGSR